MEMTEERKHWQEGMKTHENITFSCFGGLSNTGITSALASLEVVKELGLEKGGHWLSGSASTEGSSGDGKDKSGQKGCHGAWLPLRVQPKDCGTSWIQGDKEHCACERHRYEKESSS